MSYKKYYAAEDVPVQDNSEAAFKETPVADQPPAPSEPAPIEDPPAPKS